ncbi:MAG: acetylglutamate kinase [Candidatus Alcyoniella australis]|nr:acetylglutamate kinase [Candidatus Alcyoniella australis]
MIEIKRKAATLAEALPYITRWRNAVFVIKVGGSLLDEPRNRQVMLEDVALLSRVGIRPVLVHGGGKLASRMMKDAQLEPRFIDGLRVTDEPTLKVIKQAFSKTNAELVQGLRDVGGQAIPLAAVRTSVIMAQPLRPELGFVGQVESVALDVLGALIKDAQVPVISPLGLGPDGQIYNINADEVAQAVAVQLGAEKLTLLTDVEGVLVDGELISHLDVGDIEELIVRGKITEGMIPKVRAAEEAVRAGVRKVHFIDGNIEHALLLEIFTHEGVGTEVGDEKREQ